ncbi:MAG: FliM/FliN family flagellar motor switch protein [Candidatus Methylomirabilis sp.]|nr:FliM/FliN family flagellar motor switch protein [Candidatus Methylomirabilis sp.]
MAYAEYIASVSYPACLGIFGMRPLKGGAIAELPPRLIFYIIDRILGGAGRIPDVARELTEIERALVSKLFRHTLEDLRSAWSRVDLFQFELLNLEVNPGFLQLAAPTDMVILIGFDVRIGEVEGVMNLCFPLSMLEPVLPSLSLRRWIAGHREEMDEGASGEIARAMPVVGLSVRALLGSIPLTVHELSRLNVGDIVRLDMGASSLGVLEVGGGPEICRQGRDLAQKAGCSACRGYVRGEIDEWRPPLTNTIRRRPRHWSGTGSSSVRPHPRSSRPYAVGRSSLRWIGWFRDRPRR